MRDFKDPTYKGSECACCTPADPSVKKERERATEIINKLTGHRSQTHYEGKDCTVCEIIAEINDYVPVYYYCKCGSRSTTNFQDPDYSPDVYCPQCMKRMEKKAVNE